MSVYVDPDRPCLRNKYWNYDSSCHLFADSIIELHLFAGKMGLKKGWFQNSKRLPHYDLTRTRRIQAVRQGAIEVNLRFVVDQMEKNISDGAK
jgi:hypothetical protein